MPATTVKGGKVKGEGRVISINAKYGFLAAQGINSKVFIIPSSLKLEAPFPPLTDELHVDDLVTFEATEQPERNGARYLAVDGSVKLKQRGKDVMFEGEGKIVRLDIIRGCFGFIDSADVGSVFFNISAVRPSTTDVTKILKLGQKVKFRALPNLEQPNCKWRASIVCAAGKASEFLHARTNSTSVAISSSSTSHQQTSSSIGVSSSSTAQTAANVVGQHHRVHRSGSADTRPKSSSFCSSSCASSENIAVASSPSEFLNSSFNNESSNFVDHIVNSHHHRHNTVGEFGVVDNNLMMNGGGEKNGYSNPTTTTTMINTSSNNSSLYDNNSSTSTTIKSCNFGVVGESLNGGGGGMKGYQQKNQQQNQNNLAATTINSGGSNNGSCCNTLQLNGSNNGNNINNNNNSNSNNNNVASSWPISTTDFSINPAAMWDLYLEQQQKALTQTFNPFVDVLPSTTSATATASSPQSSSSTPTTTTNNGQLQQQQQYDVNSINFITSFNRPHRHFNNSSSNNYNHHNLQQQQTENCTTTSVVTPNSSCSLINNHQHRNGHEFEFAECREAENIVGGAVPKMRLMGNNSGNFDDTICRHIKKLAHELNGWRSDDCAFCRSEDTF